MEMAALCHPSRMISPPLPKNIPAAGTPNAACRNLSTRYFISTMEAKFSQ